MKINMICNSLVDMNKFITACTRELKIQVKNKFEQDTNVEIVSRQHEKDIIEF